MEDGSWAVVRGGPHLHTVTRSEGHEGGGGIGVASISLAHPCMAPGLLSAWGEGQRGDRWDVGVGKRERSDRDIKHQGKRKGNLTKHSQEGQAQGRVVRRGKGWGDDLGDKTDDGTEESDGMGMHHPLSPSPRLQLGALCLPTSSEHASFPLKPQHTGGRLLSLTSLTKPLLLTAPPPPRPTFLAHTPPHFLGARAPPPLQTCSAHPAVAGRTQHSCQGQRHWGLRTPEG